MSHLRPGTLTAGFFIALAIVAWLINRGLVDMSGLQKANVNPPRWLQVWLIAVALLATWSFFDETAPRTFGSDFYNIIHNRGRALAGIMLGIGFLVVAAPQVAPWIWSRLRKSALPHFSTGPQTGLSQGNPPDYAQSFDGDLLRAWLQTDDAIGDPRHDAFGHVSIANRMVRRIEEAALRNLRERAPTFAIVGELGSGKSSVLGLVRHGLREKGILNCRVLIADLSLWPFESTDAAIRGILTSIETEFRKITCTHSIVGVPKQYLGAIEKIDRRFGAIFDFIKKEMTPGDTLGAYNKLAALVGVTVVVWIEDLERFQAAEGSLRRMEPVRALLYELQRFDRLTVILASDSLSSRVDLQKIARFVESIPRLDVATVWRLVSRVRESFLKGLSDAVDPASDEARKAMSADLGTLSVLSSWFGPEKSVQGAIARLCQNPRTLKSALRSAWEVWDQLRGEVDIDDVILMSIVRCAQPDIFALIDQHIDALQSGQSKRNRDEQKDDSAFEAGVSALLSGEPETKMAIDKVLDIVFPTRAGKGLDSVKPQGLCVRSHRDYWRLFLSGEMPREGERDQEILRAIVDWNSTQSELLIEHVQDDKRHLAVEHFVGSIESPRVVALLRDVATVCLGRPTSSWPLDGLREDREPPGIVPVWRMCRRLSQRGRLNEDLLTDTLKDVLAETVPKNLSLTHEILQHFVCQDSSIGLLISKDRSDSIVKDTVKLLCGFEGRADELASALVDANKHTLFWVCWRIDRVRDRKYLEGFPFDPWKDFSETVIEAARRHAQTMWPQLVPFFVTRSDSLRSRHRAVSHTPVFHRDVAERLFGINRLSYAFEVQDFDPLRFPSVTAEEIQFVRQQLSASSASVENTELQSHEGV